MRLTLNEPRRLIADQPTLSVQPSSGNLPPVHGFNAVRHVLATMQKFVSGMTIKEITRIDEAPHGTTLGRAASSVLRHGNLPYELVRSLPDRWD